MQPLCAFRSAGHCVFPQVPGRWYSTIVAGTSTWHTKSSEVAAAAHPPQQEWTSFLPCDKRQRSSTRPTGQCTCLCREESDDGPVLWCIVNNGLVWWFIFSDGLVWWFIISDGNNNNSNNRIERSNSRFFTISSLHRKRSPTHTLKWIGSNCLQIMCNTSSAYHVQHVMLRTTWYEGTAQLLSLTQLKSHLFEIYFIAWTIYRWRRGPNRSTWRKPPATSFRKCHMLQPEDSRPYARLEPAQ